MTNTDKSKILYCDLSPHTRNKCRLIEAILNGKDANQIVKERITNLSISSIYRIFNEIKKHLGDK